MKVLILSDPNSPHTIKWVRSLAGKGIDIFLFGLSTYDKTLYEGHKNIKVYSFELGKNIVRRNEGNFRKLLYLSILPQLKKVIKDFQPDLVHAHFASSYGLLGALSGFQPLLISVWGSDIYDFPKKSIFHKSLIKFNLSKANKILSTSKVMAIETNKYTKKSIEVTPFGIDLETFKPKAVKSLFSCNDIVIGTIKTLEIKYGIEYLIRAFKIVKDRNPELPLKLLIVGGGSLEVKLSELAEHLGIVENTIFTGNVKYDEISEYHNMLSIFVSVSVLDSESFGVAIIESSACEKPVVVSNVGGLPEVVDNNNTGFVVSARNPEETAIAIEKLVLDQKLREQMGSKGRKRVENMYDWNNNVNQMIEIYNNTLYKVD